MTALAPSGGVLPRAGIQSVDGSYDSIEDSTPSTTRMELSEVVPRVGRGAIEPNLATPFVRHRRHFFAAWAEQCPT